jgi:LPXTG-site transpeptidase (sortase) family protein
VLLILTGAFLVYPYVGSRLTAPSPTPTNVSSPVAPTLTRTPIAHTPTLTPTPVPISITVRAPTPTPPPVIPDRIVIPAINLDAPVVPVSWTVAKLDGQEQPVWDLPKMRAAGWHETSAPLGVPGNTVLNGHNTTNGEVFRDLYKLEVGDEIILYSGEATYTYTVTEMLILPEAGQPLKVRIENARYIQPTEDERLTLVTCHPYGSLRNRLVVIAHPVGRSAAVDYPER